MRQKLFVGLFSSVVSLAVFMGGGKAFAAVKTWDGGGADDNFSTAANWDLDAAPTNGDDLVFPASSNPSLSATNDLLTSVGSITLTGGVNAGSYSTTINDDIVDDVLSVNGNIVVGDNQALNINQQTTFTSNATITLNNKDSRISLGSSVVALGVNTLTIQSALYSALTTSSLYSDLPDVTFGNFSSSTLTGSTGSSVTFKGVDVNWYDRTTTYPGAINFDKSVLNFNENSRFGTTVGGLVLENSQLDYNGSTVVSMTEPVSLKGNLFGKTSNDIDIGYEAIGNPSYKLTIAGSLTLLTDVVFDPYSANIEVTGPISGKYLIGASQVYTVDANRGHIIINSSSNDSLLANGDYIIVNAGTVADDVSAQDIIVQIGDVVIMNGKRGKTIVSPGATFKGSGTVGALSVLGTATLAPGQSPGCINSGSLSFSPAAIYSVEVNGSTACTGYDRSVVTGTVTVTSAILSIVRLSSYVPGVNTSFMIIENDGADAVVGTFTGLVEGATVVVDNVTYRVSYVGGTGNDVTLTVQSLAPNTGAKILTLAPFMASFIGVGAASAFYMSKKTQKKAQK